jgi:N-acetylmuramoyl-L-alanine amidase
MLWNSYSIKANAEAQLEKAKKAGFTDAYIKYD